MSDEFRDDTSDLPSRSRRLLHEFPMASSSLFDQTESAAEVTRHLNNLREDVERLARNLSTGSMHGGDATFTRGVAAIAQLLTLLSYVDSLNTVRAERAEVRTQLARVTTQLAAGYRYDPVTPYGPLAPKELMKPKMPVRNLVSVLPKTKYREQSEKEFERSLEYVQVQRKILEALETHDTVLTAKEAYAWTKSIVPEGQPPKPEQALRLCYYMRSLGYDTFASIEGISMLLFLANADSEKRGLGHDHLYWVHNLRTGEAAPKAYSLLRRLSTQGALSGNPLVDIPGPSAASRTNVNEQEVRRQFFQMRTMIHHGSNESVDASSSQSSAETAETNELDAHIGNLLDSGADPE